MTAEQRCRRQPAVPGGAPALSFTDADEMIDMYNQMHLLR
jgi:hypothetical protein